MTRMSDAIEYYKKGLALFGAGDHAQAIEEYRRGLELRPDWADCLQALGMAQLNAGQHDDALATLQRVTELAPDDPLAFTASRWPGTARRTSRRPRRRRPRPGSSPGKRS